VRRSLVIAAAVAALLAGGALWAVNREPPASAGTASAKAAARPALTVTATRPGRADWPLVVPASGNIQAWQEAVVGAQVGGLRLAEVRVNVGDRVRKGDVLARFVDDMVLAELAQQKAAVDEARARLAEAEANAGRADRLAGTGALSATDLGQYRTAAATARAQLDLAQAKLDTQILRRGYTRVVAVDDGLISSRTATVGAVVQDGAELFRLIRGGRLEWRAELPESRLAQIAIGQTVRVRTVQGETLDGRVRSIAPTVDVSTRNGLVYVDLAPGRGARAGMFAQGEFALGSAQAVVVPDAAVVVRDGNAYVFRLAEGGRVAQTLVKTGRRRGSDIEIIDGLAADARVVVKGAGFLNDGDPVAVAAEGGKDGAA
jgi:RND family efflux transporter MFP subunit